MILETIIRAILFGVHLLRSRDPAPAQGPMTLEEADSMLFSAARAVPDATDWRASIVDLMKVLRLDPSMDNRVKLAAEVGVIGKPGTAEWNIALHKAVMAKVAAGELG